MGHNRAVLLSWRGLLGRGFGAVPEPFIQREWKMSHELDPVQKLEHDHHHLTRLVDDLRGGIQEVLRGDRQAAELREPLDSFMELAQEELFAHFEYEEVTLFPFLIEKMPDCRASVAELELAHDRMCGVVSRMSHMLGQGDEADKKMPRSVKGLRDKVMKQVACGTHHTLALSENSEVFAWGAGACMRRKHSRRFVIIRNSRR